MRKRRFAPGDLVRVDPDLGQKGDFLFVHRGPRLNGDYSSRMFNVVPGELGIVVATESLNDYWAHPLLVIRGELGWFHQTARLDVVSREEST